MTASQNTLQRALTRAGLDVKELHRRIARKHPAAARTEVQLGRVVSGARGASLALAAAIEDVLRDERGRPLITAAQIARLPRQARVDAGVG